MTHILVQFGIHVLTGPALIAMVWLALAYWYERNSRFRWWMEDLDRVLLSFAGLLIAALVTQREAYDLYYGHQTVAKTLIDQVQWFPIAGFGCWGLYRLVNRFGGDR